LNKYSLFFNCSLIYSCDGKAAFSEANTPDLSETILCWFADQETLFLLIIHINVKNGSAAYYCGGNIIFFQDSLMNSKFKNHKCLLDK